MRIAMADICLIIPPSLFLLDERVFMSLGILKVAAVLEQRGYHLDLVDLSGVENYQDVMRTYLQTDSAAPILGITATTPQMPAVHELAQTIRSTRPSTKLILGGPHVTLVNAARKSELTQEREGRAMLAFRALEKQFDVLVAGDGESTIELAMAADNSSLIDADDPKSELFLKSSQLDELPFPARRLVDVDSYHYYVDDFRALSMIAQLGCPFGCGFCGGRQSPFLRQVRTRSTENILAELEHMYRTFGVQGFMMYDDELNVNRGMVELMHGIAGLQRRLGTEFRLRGFIKAELFTHQQAEAMRAAGFRWLLCGFESGAPKILKNINKKATREDNTRCIEIARQNGLKVKALMSIGHPEESAATVQETTDWLKAVRPDDFDATIITTYPGTPYYDHAVPHATLEGVWTYTAPKTGDQLHSYELDYNVVADYYKGDPHGGYKAYVFTDYLSSDELVSLRDGLEDEVRRDLAIPYPEAAAAVQFEHSMGQMGQIPANIMRSSPNRPPAIVA